MSLPSFPGDEHRTSPSSSPSGGLSAGAGNSLPIWLLALCGAFTAVATGVSVMSVTLQLKNYRKPSLQRAVVRIMVMVPLYAISSLIAIFSLEAAFFIDAVRDLYEAFVIYTFFQLLITYLGGERSLLIILHGRHPIPHPFPVNLFLRPMDVSDPWTLLNLKRGVLQYVQIKPLLVISTVILKLTGKYREGDFAVDSGYTYISIVYNTSICLSLYCLAMFWVAVNADLKGFRPVPKFICVKGILFFTFWQSIGISLLIAVGAVKRVGKYTDKEHMSLALVDSLICFEMPIFAIAHQYAFQASDYIDESLVHAARLPFVYAFRDAFGLKDVWQDTKDTFRGQGVSYQAYEPAEGGLHHGLGRQKRIRAGLRYSKGGKAKYWLPVPGDEARSRGERGPITVIKRRIGERLAAREGYAPLLPQQAARIVHEDPDAPEHESRGMFDSESSDSDAPSLDFESVNDEEETLYERARRIGYAGFPNVDVSREAKQRKRREEEDGILQGRWTRERPGMGRERTRSGGKGKGKANGGPKKAVYGAWADRVSQTDSRDDAAKANGTNDTPNGEEWAYDGDVERSDAWKSSVNGKAEGRLKWTKKPEQANGHKSPTKLRPPDPPSRRSSKNNSPFALGDDDEDECDHSGAVSPSNRPLPSDARDLVVEDEDLVEEARTRGRLRGEPQTHAPVHVFVHHDADSESPQEVEEVYEESDIPGHRRVSENLDEDEMPGSEIVQRLERINERSQVTTPFEDDNPWA